MVQAANLGNGDDLASIRTLCRAPLWAVFGEREVWPGSMVVVHIGRENAPQVSLVEDDCVIQTFSADRADEALNGATRSQARRSAFMRQPAAAIRSASRDATLWPGLSFGGLGWLVSRIFLAARTKSCF